MNLLIYNATKRQGKILHVANTHFKLDLHSQSIQNLLESFVFF